MTRKIADLPGSIDDAVIEEHNALLAALGTAGVLPHYAEDASNTVSTADADSEGSAVALSNALKAAMVAHFADEEVHSEAHALTVSASDATDEASAITLINELKADYNTHVAYATSHRAAAFSDATEGTTDASNTATLYALCNSLKALWNQHCGMGADDLELVAS